MLDESNHIGEIVKSKAGRDEGKCFLIVSILNEDYVFLSDGSIRTIEKPKKKKNKHLIFTGIVADEIKEQILSGEKVSNSRIRKYLQSIDMNKEV